MAASAPLKHIVSLLSKGSVEESIAAAVVLGALAPKETSVIDALAKNLGRGDNLPLALASARALGRIGNAQALAALLPLLEAKGDLRDVGALAIADCGRAALPAVRKALGKADFDTKRVLYGILARMRTADALGVVMDGFFEESFELVKAIGRTLREEAASQSPAERAAAVKTVLAFLKEKRVRESRSAVSSTIIYLGALGSPEAIPAILPYAEPGRPAASRRHALQAIRSCLGAGAPPAKVAETLFPYLDDPDLENVVEPALAVLDRADLPPSYDSELARLTGGRYPRIRQFAVRKLARSEGKKAAETLVALLDGKDEDLRRAAVHALKGSDRAPELLLPRLLDEKDADKAWEMVHLVKERATSLKAADLKKLAGTATAHLDKGDRRAESLLHLLRRADEAVYFATFHDRAMKAKSAGRFADAERDLRLISRSPGFDAEARFQLGLVMLRDMGAKATPASPKSQEALRVLRGLASEEGFDLGARIKKEGKALGTEGVYTLAFGLVEGPGASRPLGATLLKSLVKKGPQTKLGKMARSKLETEGLA